MGPPYVGVCDQTYVLKGADILLTCISQFVLFQLMPRIFQPLTPFVSLFPIFGSFSPSSLAIRFISRLTFPDLCHLRIVPCFFFPHVLLFLRYVSFHPSSPVIFSIILVRFIFLPCSLASIPPSFAFSQIRLIPSILSIFSIILLRFISPTFCFFSDTSYSILRLLLFSPLSLSVSFSFPCQFLPEA